MRSLSSLLGRDSRRINIRASQPGRFRASTSWSALTNLGVRPSRVGPGDLLREASITVLRSPARTLLTALATALGVAAVTSIVGLSQTAGAAVSDTFDVLRATVVTFTDENVAAPSRLTLDGERALTRLNGVVGTGLSWRVHDGQPQPVRRSLTQAPLSPFTPQLPICAISARALSTIGATIGQGRTYDTGMEARHLPVAILGAQAAARLGVTSVQRTPVIYVKSTPMSVIGIVTGTELNGEILTCVNLPTTVAADLGLDGRHELVTRTSPGAARIVASQGPYALDPLAPDQFQALAPADPTQLRAQVGASLGSLMGALALVSLAVGVVAIANTTLLTVMARRAEIGLRRATGAAPRHITALILAEASETGTMGGVVGTSLGVVIVAVTSASKGWAPVLDPALLVTAPLIGTAAGLLAGIYPSIKATRITPLEALQR